MKLQLINPLTICIAALIVLTAGFFLILSAGKHLGLVSKIFFAPFLLDITRGVGQEVAAIFRWVVFGTQAVLGLLVVLRCLATHPTMRLWLSIAGILLTLVHAIIVSVGYITTGLH